MLSAVVGRVRWKSKVMEEPISSFVKPGLEAFAILLYVNGYHVWQEKYEQDPTPTAVIGVHLRQKFRYTASSKSAKRNAGWPPEAIEDYNDLYRFVVDDRKAHASFDEAFMVAAKAEGNRKRKAVASILGIRARNDLDSDDEEDETSTAVETAAV
jgi:hypothetical protein